MIRRPPRSTQSRSSAASDVYKRQDMVPALALPPTGMKRRATLSEYRWMSRAAACDCGLASISSGASKNNRAGLPLALAPLLLTFDVEFVLTFEIMFMLRLRLTTAGGEGVCMAAAVRFGEGVDVGDDVAIVNRCVLPSAAVIGGECLLPVNGISTGERRCGGDRRT